MSNVGLKERNSNPHSLASVLDNLPDGVAVVDGNIRPEYVNHALCRLLEYETREELMEQTPESFLREGELEYVKAQFKKAAETDSVIFQTVIRTLKGRFLPVEANVTVLYDENHEPQRFIVTVRDVSERREAEEALQHSREMLQAIVENIAIGIALINPEMEILELNRTLREWFPKIDVAQHPICYRTFNDPPKDGPCSYCPTIKTLQDGRVHEAITQTPMGGEIRNYRIVSTAIRDAAGKIVGAIEMVEDVTEKLGSQADVFFKNALLEAQSEASIDGILVVDANGKMISFNRRFVQMWGIPEEVVNSKSDERALQSVFSKLVDPEGFLSRVKHLYSHPEEKSRDEILLRNGRVFDRYSAPVKGPDGSCYGRIWHFRDMTERKRFEQELEAKNRELESFVYTASHDLRSPLIGIEGFSELLIKDYFQRLDERGQEYLQYIHANVLSMNSLLADLLEVSRIGREKEMKEAVQVSDAVARVLDNFAPVIQRADAQVKVADDLPAVRYSSTRLYQVFSNLISNAVKFSREGVPPRVEIGWEPLQAGSGYLFFVRDNGIGIQEEDLHEVFDLFRRLKEKDVEGTGVGLAIVKRIVEENGGEVGVESTPGQGSTFWFTVPTEQGSDEEV